MPIIYALVARGATVLAEHATTTGNVSKVTQSILEKIPSSNSKMSYVYDRYLFHYVSENGMIYLCMADEEFGRRVPFMFLEDIKQRFKTTYGDRSRTAMAYAFNEEFSRVLARQMDHFSTRSSDKISDVQGEINAVKEVMVQNIEKVLERGERMELLVDKTDNLNQQAFQFKKKSTELKRAMWWKNTKLMIMIFLIVAVIIFFIVWFACGIPDFYKC